MITGLVLVCSMELPDDCKVYYTSDFLSNITGCYDKALQLEEKLEEFGEPSVIREVKCVEWETLK